MIFGSLVPKVFRNKKADVIIGEGYSRKMTVCTKLDIPVVITFVAKKNPNANIFFWIFKYD